jgi:hypothetical protein
MANLRGLFANEFLCLIGDNDEEAANYRNMALDVYNHYNEKIGPISNERLQLGPLPAIRQRVLEQMLDPKAGMLEPNAQNYLRTKVPAKVASATEAPPIPEK